MSIKPSKANKLMSLLFFYSWLFIPFSTAMIYYMTDVPLVRSSLGQYCMSAGLTFSLLVSFYTNKSPIININKQYALIMLSISILLIYIISNLSAYYSFYVPALDFSVFMTMLESADIGNYGYSSVVSMYHLGMHANWILAPVYLIYKLWPCHETLLVLASIIMWLPGLQLYYYVKSCLKLESYLAFLAAIVYWTGYYTISVLNGHFYPEFMYIPLFFALLIARESNKSWPLIIFALLFAMVKEDSVFYLLPWSIYNMIFRKDLRFGIVFLISILVFILDNQFLQPYFLHKTNLSQQGYYVFWSSWGGTPLQIMINMLTHPLEVLAHVYTAYGWKRMLGSLLFIPLFSLDMISFFILPLFIYSLANLGSGLNNLENYYSYLIWPACLVGYLQVYARLQDKKIRQIPVKLLLLLVLVLSPLWGMGGLRVYRVNYLDYQDFKQLYITLKPNQEYCVSGNLYSQFDVRYYRVFGLNQLLQHPGCSIILSPLGDQYPYNESHLIPVATQQLVMQGCLLKQFGNFYQFKNTGHCNILAQTVLKENLKD